MAKKIYYCENHPDTVASYQCAVCKKRMCYNCAIHSFGNFYCSTKCLVTDISDKFISLIFQVISGIQAIFTIPFRKKKGLIRHSFIELILVAGLAISFFFIWKLNSQLKSFYDKKSFTTAGKDTTLIPSPEIFTPNRDGMVLQNTITIKGRAEQGRIISLLKNNRIVDAKLIKNGPFTFKNIKLNRGINKLDVRAISADGRISNFQTITLTYAPPSLSFLAADFNRGSPYKKKIAFTFDAGAEDNAADEILDTLKEYGVKATFFLTGRFIKKYPLTVKKIVQQGHEVGNHTLTHPHLTTFASNRRHLTLNGITKERIKTELTVTDSIFYVLTGRHMARLWRAPYGEFNKEILMWAAECGYRHTGWTRGKGWQNTLDTMDWVADKKSPAYHTAEEICSKVINYGKSSKDGANGIIILMHLGTNRKDDFPHRKLGLMIRGLKKRGYTPVTISQLMGEKYILTLNQ